MAKPQFIVCFWVNFAAVLAEEDQPPLLPVLLPED